MSRITDIAKTMKTWWDEDDDAFVQSALDEIIRIDREQLPTIEPKRGKADSPQGEWIDAEIPLESGGSMPIQACNLCKTFYPLAYTGGGHRFCPNCGARMKGVDDE